jgi:Fe/S biogenesis protein NfuA
MITITDVARDKIRELMTSQGKADLALRFGIRGRGPGGFLYRLAFVDASERSPSDRLVEASGISVLVDDKSAPSLEGVRIDFVQGHESGFKIDNPNPLWADPVASAVQTVLDQEINPAVNMHGGFVTLIDVQDGTAFIELGGGCQGCGMVDVTLKQGIEVRIREVVPQIREVVDTTDHAQGRNPYYQPAKGGSSPFAP